jgi:hypothetical protein
MSIDKRSYNADASTSARMPRGAPLTTANLIVHERATTTISASNVVRGWLAASGDSRQINADPENWMQLVARDHLAAAIEAIIQNDPPEKRDSRR